jgi:hypothetical protein
MCWMLLLLTQRGYCLEMLVFLQLSWIGIFGANTVYLHLETLKFQEVFPSKINSILTGKLCARFYCVWNTWFSFERYTCFELSWKDPLGTKRGYLYLEKPKLQEVFLSKLSPVLTGKQCAGCSCLWHRCFSFERYTYFQLSWIGLLGTKRSYLHLEKPKLQEVFLLTTNSVLTGKQCGWCS